MDDFDRYLKEQMKDPDFQKEWDENEARYQLLHLRRSRRDLESGWKYVSYSFTRKQNPPICQKANRGVHLCTHESEFHSEQAYSIEDTEDGDAGIREDGDPHIGIA